MSHPRVHQMLSVLFEQKDPSLLVGFLTHQDYADFQTKHGLKIDTVELLKVFTHTSFSHEFNIPHQEQLEFLGDSVLQLILTEELYRRYPEEKEGRLSRLRSSIVNEKSLAIIANDLHLGELLLVGRGEYIKRLFEQDTVLADTIEALLAQIYRFHGLEFTSKLFLAWLQASNSSAFEWKPLEDYDAKSKVQEMSLAKYKKLPRYAAETVGDKFEVRLWINEELLATGVFSSKKSGEKELAAEILKRKLI